MLRSSAKHLSHYKKVENDLVSRKKYYIDIPLPERIDRLGLVIHVEKGGVYLDEIEVLEVEGNSFEPSQESLISVDEITYDSNRRLKIQYQIEVSDARQSRVLEKNSNVSVVSIVDCFEKELGETHLAIKDYSLYSVDGLKLHGQLCLKIINSKEFSTLRLDSLIPFHAYEIKSQILRGGYEVHDAVVKLKNNSISMKSKSIAYLLIDVDKSAYSRDNSEALINVYLDDNPTALSFTLKKKECEKLLKPMDFNVWAYTANQPIWDDRNKINLARELSANGINIHTIHPRYIPKLGSDWTIAKKEELLKEVQIFDNNIEFFLWVTDWSLRKKYITLTEKGELAEESKSSIRDWLAEFNQFLNDENLSAKKMVLYPVDEPFGEKLVSLKAIISFLSEEISNIMIYANPSASRKGSASEKDLLEMAAANIFWQPSWKYIQKIWRAFFSTQC